MKETHEAACCAATRNRDETQHDEPAARAEISQGAAPLRGSARARRHADELIDIPGGTFLMGTDDAEGFPDDGEGPVREVTISPFRIDRYSVTNELFAEFVEETGYTTEAERFGWSYVFHLFVPKKMTHKGLTRRVPGLDWWLAVTRAYWRRPEGPGSNVRDRLDHPVVHVSWADATAYCAWAHKRLPTESEWEYAARGGLVQKRFVWGDELTPNGRHMCNVWQGAFPRINTREDGFASTCPVDSYEPNGYGLYNMAGNVWEWCADNWSPSHGTEGSTIDPIGPVAGTSRVMRGGSYLCHDSYCNRYRVAARTSNTPDSSTGNMGFRAVDDDT